MTKKEILKNRVRNMYWSNKILTFDVPVGADKGDPLPSMQVESLMEVLFEELWPDNE